jgi:formylglycine-generating enzyme required for sulfatase activity
MAYMHEACLRRKAMNKFILFLVVSLAFLAISGSDVLSQASREPTTPAVLPGLERTFKDPYTGMEFVLIKGGCYQMGDTFEDGRRDEKPVHNVCVDDLYLGIHEVTQGQWEKVMGSNPSYFKKGSNYPVEQVSWEDVQQFIDRLNNQTGRNYRLPTEAEWEYAARSGGKREKYAGTSQEDELKQYAWFSPNSDLQTHPVGQKRPNGLGLYDMTGNVAELCLDWYGENYYQNSPSNNPKGPNSGTYRVLRGNSYFAYDYRARASARSMVTSTVRNNFIGFRLGSSAR